LLSGKGEEDIGALVDEVDDEVRGQGRSQTFGLNGEDKEVGVGGNAVLEEGEGGVLG
jgi:hypothetical protein